MSNWLKPLDGGSWWNEPARQFTRKNPEKWMRTVGGVKGLLSERIAKAKELEQQNYIRGEIAQKMGVSPSTVTKWLGAKQTQKKRKDRGGMVKRVEEIK